MDARMFAGGLVRRFQFLFWGLLFSIFSAQTAQAAPVVVSVDHRVAVSYSKPQFNAGKRILTVQASIKNRSGTALMSPMQLSFDQTLLRSLRIQNAHGFGKDGRPYFDIKLPKGLLLAKARTEPIKVVIAVEGKEKNARLGNDKAILAALRSAQRVSAGVAIALLTPSASPYALAANSGKQTVRISVPVTMTGARTTPAVYLRRQGDRQRFAMNDSGKEGDFRANDGIHGTYVQIDTNQPRPDSCLYYEAVLEDRHTEIVSSPVQLCVSRFPLTMAEPNLAQTAVFPDGTKAVADEILMSVKPSISAAVINELARSVDARVVGSILPMNIYHLRLSVPASPNRLVDLISQLKKRWEVENATINAIGQAAMSVDDPAFNLPSTDVQSQHGLKLVLGHDEATNANAWDAGVSGVGVTVVVMDTGLESSHTDLDVAWTCQNATLTVTLVPCVDTAVGAIPAGHGTQVAGVIAARTNNSQGVAGVAYGSSIHSIKMGSFATSGILSGFQSAAAYVGTNGNAKVVNASLYVMDGISDMSSLCGAVESVVTNAGVARAVVINAAGNKGVNGYSYPARCKDLNPSLINKDLLITVSNSASFADPSCGGVGEDQRCEAAIPADVNQQGSNYGAWVDIAAPGSVIRTTTIGNSLASPTGTSFSAPMVSGTAAILASCGASLGEIRSIIIDSATELVSYPLSGPNPAGTTPRLDIRRALSFRDPTAITPAVSSIYEGNMAGATIASLMATDPDTCDKFTFTLVAGVGDIDNGAFSITGNQLSINGSANYEAKPFYNIRVRVTDFGGLIFELPLTVNVVNVNEPPAGTNGIVNTNENTAHVFNASNFGFTDPLDSPPNNLSEVIITTLPAAGQLALSGTPVSAMQSIAAGSLGNLTFTPAPGAIGTPYTSFTFQVVDDGGTANGGINTDATPNLLTINVIHVPVPPSGSLGIDGLRQVSAPQPSLHVNTSTVSNPDGWGIDHYQWSKSDTPPPGDTPVDIVGATNPDYSLVPADIGDYMRVCATYTDPASTPICSGTDTVMVGDPHITTVDGLHYDFQGAGEFVALSNKSGLEIQVRQTPVSTASPLTDGYSGLTSGVSVNSAVAARVGQYRVTYQADPNNNTASGAPVLRLNGVVTTLPAEGIDLGDGGRVVPQGGGIQIDFPDQTTLIVSIGQWVNNVWWMHLSVNHTSAFEGIMGARKNGSWLPRLSNGSAFGVMPVSLHDRYIQLYEKFADSWRVTDKTSLFDYAEGTSTATFTNRKWPTENGPYVVGTGPVATPLDKQAALLACRDVAGKNEKADCVFDVRVMGNGKLAKGHLLHQKIRLGAVNVVVRTADRLNEKGELLVTAKVVRHATVVPKVKGIRTVPAGTVQFMLGDKPLGKAVKLDEKGQATFIVSRQDIKRFKEGKQAVTAQYLPAKDKANVFLPSISKRLTPELLPAVLRAGDIR